MNTKEVAEHLKNSFGSAIQESECCDQITLDVNQDILIDLLTYLKKTPSPGYDFLMDLTGVDYLEPIPRTKVVYWLHNPTNFQRIRICVYAERDQKIPSIISLWPGAKWYERELYDLFGVQFDGHPDLKRILMPDDWQGHPLRKDYPLTEEPVDFKHGVKPKVPSEIIHIRRKQKL